MDREALIQLASKLCEAHHCTEKVRKIHFHQLVDHRWQPHPPAAFINWWKTHPASRDHDAVRAFNCSCYSTEFNPK